MDVQDVHIRKRFCILRVRGCLEMVPSGFRR